VRCLLRFISPDRASRPSRRFATIKVPFPLRPRPSLHSTLYFILSPLFALPLAGRAAQPPEFNPRDVVGLTWSPLAILPPSRLAALIHPFLEPNFPRRWSDSDVGVGARPSQPGRSLPNPAPGPPPLLSLFLRPFVFFCHTMLSSTRGFTRKEETIEGHEWQAQRIIGERQTPSGLEDEVSLEKTLWLPKATLDTKLVRRYRAEQRAATRVRTRWSSRLQKAAAR
jgi:hypothetical protein